MCWFANNLGFVGTWFSEYLMEESCIEDKSDTFGVGKN